MILIIFEDGRAFVAKELTEGLKASELDGCAQVFDCGDESPKELIGGAWWGVPSYPETEEDNYE